MRFRPTEAPSGHQELLFDQGAERVGSLTAAARPHDDPFGLHAGNAVLSRKVADLIGLTTSDQAPPASVRSVIRHGDAIRHGDGTFPLARDPGVQCYHNRTLTRLNLQIKSSSLGMIAPLDANAKFATARCPHSPVHIPPVVVLPLIPPPHDRGTILAKTADRLMAGRAPV